MSILGKPITAPTSGLKPEIVVTTAPSATLMLSENGVPIEVWTSVGGTQHTFKGLSVGHTYTVTASDGTMSFSRDVYCDLVAQYPVTVYPATLYWDGTDVDTVTGGLVSSMSWSGSSAKLKQATKRADYIDLSMTKSTTSEYWYSPIRTTSLVQKNGYTKLKVLVDVSYTGSNSCSIYVWTGPNDNYPSRYTLSAEEFTASGEILHTHDLSSNQSFIACVMNYFGKNTGTATTHVKHIWLE